MTYPDQSPPAYTGGDGYPPVAGNATPPSTVTGAFGLMLLRALISLISLVIFLTLRGTIRDRIIADNPGTNVDVDTLVNTAVTIGVVVGAIFLVLYLALAFRVRAGKQWARVVTFILAALGVLSIFSAFTSDGTTLSKVLGIVSSLIDLVIIILLAMRPTSEYIAARRGRV